MRIWACEDCKQRFDYNVQKPTLVLKGCVFYGDIGRPSRLSNGKYDLSVTINATFQYCDKC